MRISVDVCVHNDVDTGEGVLSASARMRASFTGSASFLKLSFITRSG